VAVNPPGTLADVVALDAPAGTVKTPLRVKVALPCTASAVPLAIAMALTPVPELLAPTTPALVVDSPTTPAVGTVNAEVCAETPRTPRAVNSAAFAEFRDHIRCQQRRADMQHAYQ